MKKLYFEYNFTENCTLCTEKICMHFSVVLHLRQTKLTPL